MNTLKLTKNDFNENGLYIGTTDLTDYDGDIELDSGLGWCRFALSICAKGHIRSGAGTGISAGCGISAGWGISAGEGISAGWGISAGEGISAGWGISAGEGISAKLTLRVGFRIFAGISTWLEKPNREQQLIRVGKLESGAVCYGELEEVGLPEPSEGEPKAKD